MLGMQRLEDIKGVGDAMQKKLALAGIKNIADLIYYLPRRYDDYSSVTPVVNLRPGQVTIEATIKQAKGRYARRGLHITEAVASDESGSVRLVWFNQPYRANNLKPDTNYYISGEFGLNYRHLSIMNPSVELTSDFPINTARIVPVYREVKGLKSRQIRQFIREALPAIRAIDEPLPAWLIKDHTLMAYSDALEAVHFPKSTARLQEARRRLGFQEVFELILASLLNKQENSHEIGIHVPFDETTARNFVAKLPFKLTDAQRKVIWNIYNDMEKPQPMNRLVEGDVGSGKTVVAAMVAAMVARAGMQTAFMAPTELLARQHAMTLHKLYEPLGQAAEVVLLVGGMKKPEKLRAKKAMAEGKAKIIVGTHALIQEDVDTHKLGLIVIDEQHRFGVEQRKKLMAKAGHMPHVLSLTATPIPRSLALTLYGELDISILDTKPAGRQPVQTELCSPNSRKQLYERIDREIGTGRQMFVVCPLITEGENSKSQRSVEQVAKEITQAFPKRTIETLHGKMKADEKNKIMESFVAGSVDILVSTTVIEVGVDVPNASIMLIESAERFGLAQIHQLRGRIGRGGHAGYCYLMMSDSSAPSQRLRALESSNDGFRLAELDLELRGPGAIYGNMQHGQLDLRIANLADTKLIAAARQGAVEFIERGEELIKYKELAARVTKLRAVTNLN